MCELFAISSSRKTNVTFSLDEFSKHGGLTGPHKDGWGIAFYVNKDVQIIKEATSAANSEYFRFVNAHKIQSKLVISHIRKATQGGTNLENTQPFCRELGGRMHVFAHNGDLKGIQNRNLLEHTFAQPLGDTDSEFAFCGLMASLEEIWRQQHAPSIEDRINIIQYFAGLIKPLGPANFIYSDSEYLFAHGHKRTHGDDKIPKPPGLYFLCRTCQVDDITKPNIAGLKIQSDSIEQKVVLIASVPLTNENWTPFHEGELAVFQNGEKLNVTTD